MNRAQGSPLLFQLADVRARFVRLPRSVRLAVYGLAAFLILLVLGLPQALYRHLYVWLAYPAAWVLDVAQGYSAPSWAAWTRNIDVRYAALHTPGHGGLGGMIALEVLTPLVFLGFIAWRVGWFVYTRPRPLKPSTAHGSARWMTKAEMRRLPYTGAPLLLGERDGVSVAMDRDLQVLNTLLIGPIGSGKTSGFILPNLLRETGERDLVIADLKMALLQKAYTHLSKYYDVWVLNFFSPETSMAYNPLACCTDPLVTALWCDTWVANTGKSEKEPFWDKVAREVLMAGIFHLRAVARDTAARTGRPAQDVTLAHLEDFLTAQTPHAVIAALEESPSSDARKSAFSFMASLKANDKLLGSVFAEIKPRFTILSDERVRATTSRNEVRLSRLGTGEGRPVAVFLALDPDYIEELRPLSAGFFSDLYRVLGDTARKTPGGELRRDVMIYGDEWGNIGQVAGMKKALNLLRSAGVYGVYAFQMRAQGIETYTDMGWQQLEGAFNTKVALSNMNNTDAKWFSEVLGQATEVTQGASVQRGRFQVTTDRGGQNQSETKRPLATPDEVQNMGERDVLAKVPNLPAVRLMQRRYFDDAEVRDRAPAKGESWVAPLGPERTDGRLTPPPPLELAPPPAASVEAQEAQPEHEHEGDDPFREIDAAGVAGNTGEDERAVDIAWYSGPTTATEPDVDR